MSLQRLLDQLHCGDDARAEMAAQALRGVGEYALVALSDMCASEKVDSRWWATRVLGEVPGPAATELLVKRLKDDDADVRAVAILSLGQRNDPAAVNPLLAILLESGGYEARHAADALARLGDLASPVLVDALTADHASVRINAARALARLSDGDAVPALVNALDDESAVVAHWAAVALKKRGVGMLFFEP